MIEADWMKSRLKMPAGKPNKDLQEYAKRIYKENKAFVDAAVNNTNEKYRLMRLGSSYIKDPEKWFIRTITDFKKYNKEMSIKEIVNHLGYSSDYVSGSERSLINITKAIRNEENFKRFRKIIKYEEIDWNRLSFKETGDKATFFTYILKNGTEITIEAPYDSKHGHLNFYIT